MTHGTTNELALLRPRKNAFCSTSRACASAVCVNWYREATSPAAKTLRLDVRRLSSTSTPCVEYSMPAASRPRPPTRCDENLVDFYEMLLVADKRTDLVAVSRSPNFLDRGTETNLDTVSLQLPMY